MEYYIKKNDVVSLLMKEAKSHSLSFSAEAYERAANLTACMPNEDVQPVKHGKWESSQRTIETGMVYCSNCAIEYYISDLQTVGDCNGIVHYCPACGARMDLKDGETN